MSNLNVDSISSATPGGTVDFSGPNLPTFNGAPVGFGRRPSLEVPGTSYTIQASDLGKLISFTSGSAVTVAIPATARNVSFSCGLFMEGAGTLTVALAPGVTMAGPSLAALPSGSFVEISEKTTNNFVGLLGGVALKEFVEISDYGDVTTNSTVANATFVTAMAAISSSGGIVNPKGSLVDFSAVTVPNGVMVVDLQGQRIISSNVGTGKSLQAGGGHLLVRDVRPNQATRVHQEPNGYVAGTASKYDWMFDPYENDGANYRIANVYTKNYDPADASTTAGNNGVVVLGTKGVGNHFGIFPAFHLGFMDDGPTSATPFKSYYFDTGDTAWRTPMKGAWRSGVSVTSGDYYLASFHLYQASSTGTTGATVPVHTSGTVSDGGVNWLFIRDFQATSGGFRGCVVIGDRDDLPKFGLPSVRAQIAQDVALWNGKKIRLLDNSGASVWSVFTNGLTDDFYLESEDGTKRIRVDATGQFIQLAQLALATTGNSDSSLSTTPSIKGVRVLTFGNASSVTVTAFSEGISNQEFYVRSSNINTTLQHNANIRLLGASNKTIGVDDTLLFLMNTAGTVATQVI